MICPPIFFQKSFTDLLFQVPWLPMYLSPTSETLSAIFCISLDDNVYDSDTALEFSTTLDGFLVPGIGNTSFP